MKKNGVNQTDDIINSNNSIKYLSRNRSSKIHNFHVLCIYDKEGKLNSKIFSKTLYDNIVKGNISTIPVFHESIESDTYIIWEQSYQENEELFLKLRRTARNELILRIAKNIVAFLLKKYEDYFGKSINNHPKLKDENFIEQLIQKFNFILKKDTFLVNHVVWEEFCRWFKTYLINWVLEDMEHAIGLSRMEKLNEIQLNKLFYKYITKNLSGNRQFIVKFTEVVDYYVQDWIEKIISSLELKDISMEETKKLLDLKDELLLGNNKNDTTLPLVEQGNLLVMSNAPYQSVREAISKNSFKRNDHTPWPTAQLSKGAVEGIVQIKPYRVSMNEVKVDPTIIQESWNQVKELSELDVDVYDALCSFFLSKANHHQDVVTIYLDDLLAIRGLKPKLGGNGRRGGYENYQRKQILKALSAIRNLWINLEKVTIYKKGKPVHTKLQGRAFIFKDQNNDDFLLEKQSSKKKFMFTVDEVFAKYLYGSGRQVALLPIQALQYNPYQEKWEKKLIRYLSWRWRTQARRGDYLQPHKISTLLDAMGEKMNERAPSRTRDRLEQAFDTLLEDGVISSWQYEKWNESIASTKGWARVWRNSTILIDPPEFIREQYRPIEKNKKVHHNLSNHLVSSDQQKSMINFGDRIKAVRIKLGLTLLQVAEELEISVSYLSNIERGIKIPSNKIKSRVMKWMQSHEFNY